MPPWDPLKLEGTHRIQEFSSRCVDQGPSSNAQAVIRKIELLKDVRAGGGHWKHEFLVFTVVPISHPLSNDSATEELSLRLERCLDDDGTWTALWTFLRNGFIAKNEYETSDILTFFKAGSEEDMEDRQWATSLFEIILRPSPFGPFRLKNLAELFKAEKYWEKYPTYGLFSANCWALSRGILFDVVRHPNVLASKATAFRRPISALRTKTDGSSDTTNGDSLTKEELTLELLTNYGAFGKALLHFTSDEFRARNPTFVTQTSIRAILWLYSAVDTIMWARKCITRDPSNWTVCLRTMHIHDTKTTDDKGCDFTNTYLPPNFSRLVPTVPAFTDTEIANSLCVPGRYLYLLTSPLAASHAPGSVKSIHVYIFGYLSKSEDNVQDELPDIDELPWISLCVIRPSGNGESIMAMGERVNLQLAPRFTYPNQIHYSGMRIFESAHPLTRSMRNGDVLAVWGQGRSGMKLTVRIGSVKIVTSRPFGSLDLLFLVYSIWEMGQIIHNGASLRAVKGFFLCLPYLLSTRFEGWVWSNIGIFARTLHASFATTENRND